ERMREANREVARILEIIRASVKPGVSTGDLEEIAAQELKKSNLKGAFKGVPNPSPKGMAFPANLCTSVNDEIVHGIPSKKRVLKDGDLLSVDFGVYANGFYGDAAISVAVGSASPLAARLIDTAQKALAAGISVAVAGNTVGDIGVAVQRVVEKEGFNVVREFVGHGIGASLHEDPQVPNFGIEGRGVRLKAGMVLAIEPMINAGASGLTVDSDGWTARTRDGSLAAHTEHTVAITENGPVILTLPG
ncbi:type I methionyl aminopeptidase, partial [bacterium]